MDENVMPPSQTNDQPFDQQSAPPTTLPIDQYQPPAVTQSPPQEPQLTPTEYQPPIANSQPSPKPAPVSPPAPNQTPPEQTQPTSNAVNSDAYADLPDDLRPQPEKVVYEWTAPSRPFKKQDRQFYLTIGAILFLISLILFFANQFLAIAVVVAIGFLGYVMSAIAPEIIKHQITTYGIRTDNQLYAWEELGRFWLDERFGQIMVKVEVSRFPNHLTLLIGDGSQDEIVEIFSQVLLQEKPALTSFDRAADWLTKRFPLRGSP